MKALLMYADKDFDLEAGQARNAPDLTKDLELNVLLNAMSSADQFLLEIARCAVLSSLHDLEAIRYRQELLQDCLERPQVVRELYAIAVEAIEREKRIWGWMSDRYPEGTLHRATDVLHMFLGLLQRLRRIADEHGPAFHSPGFGRFFLMLRQELDDQYLGVVEEHLKQLQFPKGLLARSELGAGGKGINYVLLEPPVVRTDWRRRMQSWVEDLTGKNGGGYTYEVDSRDEAGFRALSDLRILGIRHVAVALAQSTDHILNFFKMLRAELGFYVACMNLHDRLAEKQEPVCFPLAVPDGRPTLECEGLYDVCLSLSLTLTLTLKDRTVGNDVMAEDKSLVMITGANRGGKSTFLRSVGIAQLMMQCGMFVPAKSFRSNISAGIFTHFKREEDAGMKSGKLDEELTRMSAIVDQVAPRSMVLLNESFASTNEREGSEIARQIVRALIESEVRVFYVTHMFDLAEGFYHAQPRIAHFLRAERLADGRRTFRIIEGAPMPTSHGEDLLRQVFAPEAGSPAC